ncbi:acyl-CoA thioesterase [Phenylobacterium sp.]|uniref:acyl-CoA thioesterase n=1 Tax=Phenylobacterium sp. TaxID=1871053 RepID=UPI0035B06368
MSRHALDVALELEALGEGRFGGRTTPEYWNMGGPFGGVTAALLLRAVLAHPARRGRPVAQTVNFCAAIGEGGFVIEVRLARDGRSTQHWQVEMSQEGRGTVTTGSVVTGAERQTWAHASAAPPPADDPSSVPAMPTAGRNAWLSQYEFRVMEGRSTFDLEPPGEIAPARSKLWVRDKPERALDYEALAGLADTFIVRILLVRGYFIPVATVSLTTYFLAGEADLARQGARPLLAVADARAFRGGFADQSGELWADDGTLLAVSHQVTWYRE